MRYPFVLPGRCSRLPKLKERLGPALTELGYAGQNPENWTKIIDMYGKKGCERGLPKKGTLFEMLRSTLYSTLYDFKKRGVCTNVCEAE